MLFPKVFFILALLWPASYGTITNIQCAIITKLINEHKYKIRAVRCKAEVLKFPTSQLQKIKFIETNIITTELIVKTGTHVHFTYSDEELARQRQQQHQLQIYGGRHTRGLPLLPFFTFLSVATMVSLFGIAIDQLPKAFPKPMTYLQISQEYVDQTYNQAVSKDYPNNNTLVIAHYRLDPAAVAARPISMPARKGTVGRPRKPTCPQPSKSTQKRFIYTSDGRVILAPSGQPPPTKPPWVNKKLPADASVIILDDDEDDDVVIIEKHVDLNEETEIEVISNEVHIPVQPGTSVTVNQCQPSTSSGITHQLSVSPARSISLLSSSSSDASLDDSIDQLFVSMPTLRDNPGELEDQFVGMLPYPVIPEDLYWNGLIWGTSRTGVTNTCNYDSYLSHVIYMSRRDPDYFRRNLNLLDSVAETAIRSITNLFRSVHAMDITSSRHAHMLWRNSLVNPLLDNPADFPVDPKTGVINMASVEDVTVHGPLSNSSLIWFLHDCQCTQNQAMPIDEAVSTYNANRLHSINNNQFVSNKNSKTCKICKVNFTSRQTPVITPATWFHSFPTDTYDQVLEDYPLTMNFRDITTGNLVEFELGFFTYSTRVQANMGHVISVHNIDGTFRFYNGMQNYGRLQNLPTDLNTGVKYEMNFVTYFRK